MIRRQLPCLFFFIISKVHNNCGQSILQGIVINGWGSFFQFFVCMCVWFVLSFFFYFLCRFRCWLFAIEMGICLVKWVFLTGQIRLTWSDLMHSNYKLTLLWHWSAWIYSLSIWWFVSSLPLSCLPKISWHHGPKSMLYHCWYLWHCLSLLAIRPRIWWLLSNCCVQSGLYPCLWKKLITLCQYAQWNAFGISDFLCKLPF